MNIQKYIEFVKNDIAESTCYRNFNDESEYIRAINALKALNIKDKIQYQRHCQNLFMLRKLDDALDDNDPTAVVELLSFADDELNDEEFLKMVRNTKSLNEADYKELDSRNETFESLRFEISSHLRNFLEFLFYPSYNREKFQFQTFEIFERFYADHGPEAYKYVLNKEVFLFFQINDYEIWHWIKALLLMKRYRETMLMEADLFRNHSEPIKLIIDATYDLIEDMLIDDDSITDDQVVTFCHDYDTITFDPNNCHRLNQIE